jgi:hypothetical protein
MGFKATGSRFQKKNEKKTKTGKTREKGLACPLTAPNRINEEERFSDERDHNSDDASASDISMRQPLTSVFKFACSFGKIRMRF